MLYQFWKINAYLSVSKLLDFLDHKWAHISSIGQFMIGKLRCFRRGKRRIYFPELVLRLQRTILLAVLSFLLSGCFLPKDLEQAVIDLPEEFYSKSEKASGERSDSDEWWNTFMDSPLNKLFSVATEQNHEVKIAKENFRQVGLGFGITPEALDEALKMQDAKFSPEKKAPGFRFFGKPGFFSNLGSSTLPGTVLLSGKQTIRIFEGKFEIDLFGRQKAYRKQVIARMTAEERKLTHKFRALRSNVATTYTKVRALQARQLNMANHESEFRGYLGMLEARYGAGKATKADWQRAQNMLAQIHQQHADIKNDLQVALHALTTILGTTDLAKILDTIGESFTIPNIKDSMKSGVPLDLLKNRADIQAAEKLVDEAMEEFNVSWADQFPALRLSFDVELAADQLAKLLRSNSILYALGYNIKHNVYERWKPRCNYHIAKSEYHRRVSLLKQVATKAVQEVSDSLSCNDCTYHKEGASREEFANNVGLYEEAREKFYSSGEGFMDLLHAHNNKMNAHDRYLKAQENRALDGLKLVTALGG